MILYRASRPFGGHVEPVTVLREQSGTVVFDMGGGLTRRVPTFTEQEAYFKTEAEAVAWLIDQAELEVARIRVKLVDAERKLARLQAKFNKEREGSPDVSQ